jgi:hypothetical protein
LREHFNVTAVRPDRYPAADALRVTATLLACALRRLGEPVRLGVNEFLRDATNIVVGAHLLGADVAHTLPDGTIVFNTEPLDAGGAHAEALQPFAARFRVWDYDARNLAPLRALGNRAADVVSAGYLPEMTSVVHRSDKDIDVLFYGQLSGHRRSVLAAIERRGRRVVWLHDVYGTARDAWIARSRIVLNLHYRPRAPFEVGRVAHLFANRCTVVAESDTPGDIDDDLAQGLLAAPAAQIPEAVDSLLGDPGRCAMLAEEGFERIVRRDYCRSVRRALDARHGPDAHATRLRAASCDT